jgi:hypothetical protein
MNVWIAIYDDIVCLCADKMTSDFSRFWGGQESFWVGLDKCHH